MYYICNWNNDSNNILISLVISVHGSISHFQYSRETDSSLTKARQECRQNLFNVYPAMRVICVFDWLVTAMFLALQNGVFVFCFLVEVIFSYESLM